MQALATGEEEALAELARRHRTRIVSLAYRLLNSWDLAEEVAQESLIRLHRSAGRYRPTAKFTTWLYRIVVNLSLDVRRRTKARSMVTLDGAALVAPGRPDDGERVGCRISASAGLRQSPPQAE